MEDSPETTRPEDATQYDRWEVVEEIFGRGQAEIVRGLLEANGIPVVLSQEGAGEYVYPTNIGPLGLVQLLTPTSLHDRVVEVLEEFHSGSLLTGE